jgi:uncharacterized membrane protein
MSDSTYDVVLAAYMTIDQAKKDFDALVKLVEDKKVTTAEGVLLVVHDYGGEVHITDAADHHGKKGLAWGGGVGVVAGLFAPPLLATAVVGAAAGGLIGKFVKHRIDSGIEANVGEKLPEGSAGVIAMVETADSATTKAALAGSMAIAVSQVDAKGVKGLKEGLEAAAKPGAMHPTLPIGG